MDVLTPIRAVNSTEGECLVGPGGEYEWLLEIQCEEGAPGNHRSYQFMFPEAVMQETTKSYMQHLVDHSRGGHIGELEAITTRVQQAAQLLAEALELANKARLEEWVKTEVWDQEHVDQMSHAYPELTAPFTFLGLKDLAFQTKMNAEYMADSF